MKSIVASVGTGTPVIVLNGHLDVVPGLPEDFEPHTEDGKLFGRGSYDMLGAVASMMVLMAELAKTAPACNVVLTLVPDEESGGEAGTGHLVKRGFVGDIAICGEPTNLNIAIQAKGILQLIVKVPGVAAHGSRPWLGRNAIFQALESYRTIASLNVFEESTPFFDRPSLNLAKISAGKVFNQVPDSCVMGIDIRYLPGQNPDELLNRIRTSLPDAEIYVHLQGSPVDTPPDNVWVRKLRRYAKTDFFGQDGSADTRFYAEQGVPAVEFGPSGANHHGPDEYVEIRSLFEYKEILKKFISNIKDDEDEI
ncbi:M20 family metallopeptidase [Paenibacillus elgii]|uniref:M20 family metallopeptidase n=1 Tax=Paenibacillus elgii TaxID=189691 RepID=UPI001300C13F|nr:M20/M25/M40 family metallo-hydrolase [Paenibacillus elgii]